MRKITQKFSKLLFVITVLLLNSFSVFAQGTVSGKVTDPKDGSGVAGVTVTVKGTKTATQTDADGNYRVTVPANATLIFSSVGYASQQVSVAGKSSMDISLKA